MQPTNTRENAFDMIFFADGDAAGGDDQLMLPGGLVEGRFNCLRLIGQDPEIAGLASQLLQ